MGPWWLYISLPEHDMKRSHEWEKYFKEMPKSPSQSWKPVCPGTCVWLVQKILAWSSNTNLWYNFGNKNHASSEEKINHLLAWSLMRIHTESNNSSSIYTSSLVVGANQMRYQTIEQQVITSWSNVPYLKPHFRVGTKCLVWAWWSTAQLANNLSTKWLFGTGWSGAELANKDLTTRQ